MSGQFPLLPRFIEMPVINANSVDPDQTPRSAASDLGLHCLPMSHLWDARNKWVNNQNFLVQWTLVISNSNGPEMSVRDTSSLTRVEISTDRCVEFWIKIDPFLLFQIKNVAIFTFQK